MNARGLVVGGLVATLLGLVATAQGQEFIGPGNSVTLELPLENEALSTTTAQGVRVVATFEEVTPAELSNYLSIDQQGSVLGPLTIPISTENAKTFKAKVVLALGAPDGSFKVRLHPTVENTDLFLSPSPDALDTMVRFTASCPRFSVEDRPAAA